MKEFQKDKQIAPLKMLCKRFENWLVLFDDLFCDTTQLVNINQTTVNLPFSLFSIYIFPTHYLFYVDYWQYSIDHFTVVFLVTWPLNGNEAGGDLVLIQTYFFCCVNQDVLMLASWHLHEKSREVCIKARSPPASLVFLARLLSTQL